jgi:hypothetical protein
MDSSVTQQPKAVVDEEEIRNLRTNRVSLKKASDLIGRSYMSTRTLVGNKHLISVPVGAQRKVSIYEIRRFLTHGNATEKDWEDHNNSSED